MNFNPLLLLILTIFSLSAECKPTSILLPGSITSTDTIAEFKSHRHLLQELFKKHKLKTENQWDSLQKSKPVKGHKVPMVRHQDYKVLGWHIYSNGTAYKSYNFSLLSGVIYFAYELNPKTGGYTSIHEWKNTSLIDSAKAHHCKTYLCVSNFGNSNNHEFLTSKSAQQNFTNTLVNLLKLRVADGVVLDFENISGSDRDLFTQFVITLSQKLKKFTTPYECMVCLYAIDYNKVFDIAAIDKYVDEYILMGYDFYGSFSTQTGPVAPLHDSRKGQNYSLEYAVSSYQGIAAKKLILGLPCYGAKWKTKNASIPSEVDEFISSPTYASTQIEGQNENLNIGLDHNAISRYKIEENGGSSKQIWFDDSTTLALKFDWVKYKGLGGIAPWTLNYCEGNKSLWELLNEKFGFNILLANEQEYNPANLNTKVITRVNTLNYFLNNDSIIQSKKDHYKPWQYEPILVSGKEVKRTHEIYAFYPFWKDDSGLAVDFALYSRIGYYAIVPDTKTGKIKQSFNWSRLDITKAHQYGCKVDLVVASYNHAANAHLLTSPKATQTLIKELLTLIKQTGGDGITLDFGYLAHSDSKAFFKFIKGLKGGLNTIDKNLKLNIILPPILGKADTHFAYNIEALNNFVDFFLLTGFDYFAKNRKDPDHNAPLYKSKKSAQHNINSSTLKYQSLGIPSDKFILIFPYFGKQWSLNNANTDTLIQLVSYNEFHNRFKSKCLRVFDTLSLSPYYSYKENGNTYHIWIDDKESLTAKYNFVIQNNLAGVGIWALGYDSDNHELANTLVDNFFTTKTSKIKHDMKPYEEISKIDDIIKVLLIIDISVLFLLLLFILLSLRVCFFRSLINRFIYFLYAIGFILFVGTYFLIREAEFINDDGTIAIAAFIVVACLILVKTMRDNNARKDYP